MVFCSLHYNKQYESIKGASSSIDVITTASVARRSWSLTLRKSNVFMQSTASPRRYRGKHGPEIKIKIGIERDIVFD